MVYLKNYNLLCFDLSFDENFNSFVPIIYTTVNSNFDYIDKKITSENALNFDINLDELPVFYKQLFKIVDEFKKDKILKKFDKTKKILSIPVLRKNKAVCKLLTAFLDNKLNHFLSICNEHNLALSVNLNNQKEFYSCKITLQNNALEPVLYFNKNKIGIEYSLQLQDHKNQFFPSSYTIVLLVNQPSWIVVEKKLFQINYLNSNKLIPFLKTKSVFIPNKMVVQYFDTFIKNIIQKVSITATGFDVVVKNTIKKCRVLIVNNFFKNRYELIIIIV